MQPIPNKEIIRFFKGLQLAISLKKDMPDYAKVFQLGVNDGNLIGVSTDFTRLCKSTLPNVLPTNAKIEYNTFDGQWISPILRALNTSGESLIDVGEMVGNYYNISFPLVIVMDISLKLHLCPSAEFIKYPDWQERVADCKVLNSFNTTTEEIMNQLDSVDVEFVKMNGSLYDMKLIKDGLNFMGDVACTIVCIDMQARFQDQPLKRVQGVSFKVANFSYLPAPSNHNPDSKKKATIREYLNFDFGRI